MQRFLFYSGYGARGQQRKLRRYKQFLPIGLYLRFLKKHWQDLTRLAQNRRAGFDHK
jgi:hypothetical protein